MSYDRLAPTISSKAKNCLVPVTWVKIIGGGGALVKSYIRAWSVITSQLTGFQFRTRTVPVRQ